jgi:hypothetical protein
MKKTSLLPLLFAVLAPSVSQATVYFENTGLKAGWSSAAVQSGTIGRIVEVTSPTYKSSTALLTEQTFETTQGAHSEVTLAAAQRNGEDKYYGQAIYLPSNWIFHDKNDTFQQFSPENPSGPWTLNWVQNDHLFIRVLGTHYDLGAITKASWTRLVVRFRTSTSGIYEYWVNGTKKWSISNIDLTIPNGSPTLRWSVGIYCTSWRDTPPPAGDATTRGIYHDQFRVASSYTEAEPANWGGSPTPTPAPTPTPSGTLSGYYRLMARHSGKAVVVQGASTSDSANVIQYTYGGSATNDEWEARSIGSGYYRIINRNSGKDLTVQSASSSDGANIFQYTYGGSATNDEWAIVSVGSGYYRITNRSSGKSAEVAGGSTSDSANVDQRTYGGATYQQFQLVSVP